MRIAFFGTPEPAARILEFLIRQKFNIVSVVTQPDRPKGRGQRVGLPPVKEKAIRHKLPVEQPEAVKNNPGFCKWFASQKVDLAVVAAYGKILPKELLSIPKYGFINIHASLLPKYRGAAPIQWALINGEKETGVSIFQLTEHLDDGPVIAQKKIAVSEDDNALTLSDKIFAASEQLLCRSIERLEAGTAALTPQDASQVTFAPVLTSESGEIDWKKSARSIYNRIRALVVWPAAHTFYRGKRLKIFRAKMNMLDLAAGNRLPGTILEIIKNEGLVVSTGQGSLLVLEVQTAGGKRMGAYDFAVGHQLKIGETLPN